MNWQLPIGLLAALLLAGSAPRAAEVDQIAQQKMIGLSKKEIRACMGRPARRVVVGSTDIWSYPKGSGAVEGLLLASGLNGMASWFAPDRACEVTIVMTNARVSQIVYSALGGAPLPLGEHCNFAVEACVR